MTYKNIFFGLFTLIFLVSTSVYSHAQGTSFFTGIEFAGVFGGTGYDGNFYTTPSGSESWAGFANEDASIYPFSFVDGGSITFTGATAGTDAEVYFRFEYNSYPDTEPSFNTISVTVSGMDGAPYSVEIPSQGTNTYSSFLLYVTTTDAPVSLTDVSITTTFSSIEVYGCTDTNAVNYNPEATIDDGSCEVASSVLSVTTTVCDAASSVQMTGPWWGWDPNGGPAASDNGDGSWTFTFDPAPTDNMEYLLVVDGVQEDLVASSTASEDWSCTPITDYWSYANRQWEVGSGDVTNVYGTCGACEVASSALTITTTVCDAASSVQMTGPWWGWDPNGGPAALDNGDGSWTFTFDPAPTDNMEYLLVVDGVQEDLVASSTASEDWSCTPLTDYWSYANRQWEVGSGDVTNVYGTCGVCESSDVSGCMDVNALNFDADATSQLYDQYGNAMCTYDSCENTPDFGCIYADSFGLFNEWFGPYECELYGGITCIDELAGCMDANALNFDASATTQLYDQYGNIMCTYDSCENTPGNGCMYADSFGPFNDEFGSILCETYGGIPCVDESILLITTTVCDAASSVQMTGPWWGWDPNGGPAASDNGDGSWTFTFDPAPTDNMEYLLVVDGVQEDLVASSTASEDWSCTPLTDYWSYANRQWEVGSGNVSNVYGTCGACEPDPSTILTITTTVCDVASEVRMTGSWWGWDPNGGPVASDNGDGSWTFTFDPAPTENMEYLLVVDGVQEDLVASSTASEDWSCTPLTDYWSYANRQWEVDSGDVSNVYGTCGECEVAPSILTITTTVCDATSSVQMTGPWWGWDPNGGPSASDNGDGSWTFTFDPAPTDNMEYLLVVDGVQEDLVASSTASEDWSCTPITDYWSYANRQWEVGSGDASNVYGTCGECAEVVLGCMYPNATNYNELANDDDGSCEFPSGCVGDINGDGVVATGDLLGFLAVFGTVCE